MNHEIICGWLRLSPDVWPPDHYRLLGLEPGVDDVALIEQRVHQRLDLVRGYQMIHPEQATEAMNRLAQAFVCLTEQATKKAYDRSLLGDGVQPTSPPPLPVVPAVAPAAPPPARALTAPRDPLVWMYTPGAAGPGGEVPPPPVRATLPSAPTVTPPPLPALPGEPDAPPAPPAPPAPTPDPFGSVVEAAQTSPQARRGLATRCALYHRVAHTRELLRLWHRAGKHLQDADKALGKQEASELYKLVKELEDALEDFPLLGEAGQPGYLIVNLITFDKARDLLGLTLSQRESLKRDWQAGRKFLEAHRDYLREVLHEHKQRGMGERLIRIVRAFLNEQPWVPLVVVIALAAVAVALWRTRR